MPSIWELDIANNELVSDRVIKVPGYQSTQGNQYYWLSSYGSGAINTSSTSPSALTLSSFLLNVIVPARTAFQTMVWTFKGSMNNSNAGQTTYVGIMSGLVGATTLRTESQLENTQQNTGNRYVPFCTQIAIVMAGGATYSVVPTFWVSANQGNLLNISFAYQMI